MANSLPKDVLMRKGCFINAFAAPSIRLHVVDAAAFDSDRDRRAGLGCVKSISFTGLSRADRLFVVRNQTGFPSGGIMRGSCAHPTP